MSHLDYYPVQSDRLHRAIEVDFGGSVATIRLGGPVNASARRQLSEALDWLMATGARRVGVHLADAERADSELLQLLRGARRRLNGALVVTADRPKLSTLLELVGLTDSGTARWRTLSPNGFRPHPASGGAPFELVVHATGSWWATIEVCGEVDLRTAGRLTEVLAEQLRAARRYVRLDLSAVTFFGTVGLRVLIQAHHAYLAEHGALTLIGIGPPITRLLEITGLDRELLICPPLADPLPTTIETPARTGSAQVGCDSSVRT